jgi:hypothetical protein
MAGVMVAVMTPLMPMLIPVFTGLIKDKRHAQAFAAVSRAGLLAINAAAQAMRAALEEAKRPDSDGGTQVTESEKKRIMSIGIATGIQWMKDQNIMEQVVTAYGGEDAVRLALEQIIRSKVDGA